MHFLVTITPTHEAANALDAGPGGPGPLFGWIADRYRPELFWVDAGQRSASWIIDVSEPGQLHELVHVAARKAATTPQITPVILGPEAADTIPAAMKVAAEAP
ncbi:MAG: hypothetical protein JWR88_1427 [Pseudonocardia sp.]|jgi:hypothetical protein|nr:hypothetical protein [Pseudonocardia sp.]